MKRADYTYVNKGTLEELDEWVERRDGGPDGAGMRRLSASSSCSSSPRRRSRPTSSETEPTWYERARYPLRYEQIVAGHAENYRLEPELVAAVIYQESKFDADAVSNSGAVGLMQLLPATAQGIADRTGGSGWHEARPARSRS